MVDRDANGSGEGDSESSSLDLLQGESSTSSLPVVISDSGAVNQGSQPVQWPWGNGSGLGSPCCESSLLSGSLVQPNSDVFLPVLSQMDVGDDVVVLYHLSQN